ncbi:MAG: amidohydrolase [Bacteroidales bacterium]|nr:amidohydrolase [Bacteroidales bacterium]MBR0291551.1 amidohydrolase [Bacteroidales bacterium]
MDNSLLIKNVLLDGEKKTLLCRDGRFVSLDAAPGAEAARVIDAEGLAILPAFYNTHTHAAMTLMRGYGDDRPLHEWLEQWVWPYEDSLGAKDIRRGSEIAIREMISTGTVFFNDMYFFIDETIDLVKASGMRAAIGVTLMDNHPKALRDEKSALVRAWKDSERLLLTVAPHSVYTASKDTLQEAAKLARENGRKIHIHISETAKEVKECLAKTGMTPVRYLDSLGLLGPDVIAAHCVHVDKEEWDILAERGVTVSHCPCSNMKLGSGRFPYELAIASGARITLGTDGCSSNNNLDMREEMKTAALLAKVTGDAALLSAPQVLKWATRNGAEAFGYDAGEIARGRLADAILVDLGNPKMNPCHNLISNWVYAADSSCIKYVICNGKVL